MPSLNTCTAAHVWFCLGSVDGKLPMSLLQWYMQYSNGWPNNNSG